MASPFSVFRRNQKVMIAVLGVLAMFAFVFLPIVLQNMDSGSVKNPVVVSSKFGDLQEYDINALMTQRRKVIGILTDVLQMAGNPPALAHQWVEYRLGPATEDSVVTTWVLARHAEKMGVVISDTTINNFLKELTEDRIKATNFLTAFKRAGISDTQFFSAMRDELAAMQLKEIFQTSLGAVTPAERWEYFNRVKKQATVEVVPVAVEKFLDKIDAPTDEELKAFFEKYKNDLPRPDSAEPGFREPQKIALAWFKADYEKFASPDMVTDEEIKTRYESNKERYAPPAKKAEEPAAETSEVNRTEAAKPEETKAPEVKDGAKPEETKAPEVKDGAKPEETKAPEVKEEAKKSEKEEGASDTSAVGTQSPFALASFLEEEKPADTPAADAAVAEANPAENPPATQEKPAEAPETPAVQEKAAEKPEAPSVQEKAAEKPVAPAVQEKAVEKPETSAVQEKPAETPETSTVDEKPAGTETGLTDAVKDRIRREIAYEKIQKVFEGARDRLDQYRREWSKYKVAAIQHRGKEGEKSIPEPTMPDLGKLAEQNGLTVGQTGLITQWDAQSLDVGASLVGGRSPVWLYAFSTMAEFRPEMSVDSQGDLFLFWKTDEAKERTPTFDDEGVRDRVLREWKMIQARKLALEKVDALVAEAAKSGKPLKEAFQGDPTLQVIAPPPFSWVTFGNVALGSAPSPARISSVADVDMAGEDFMRTVFGLKPGEVGAAMNAPETVAYVIRITEFTPSWNVLWKQFEVDDFSKYASVAQPDRQKIVQAWLAGIKKSADLEWHRKADQMTDSGSREEE